MTDPLTTRIAVAIHGATPPNPDAALALHRAQAERVLPVVEAEVARVKAEALRETATNVLDGPDGPHYANRIADYLEARARYYDRAALANAEEPGA